MEQFRDVDPVITAESGEGDENGDLTGQLDSGNITGNNT
jgi:hypothetical protein